MRANVPYRFKIVNLMKPNCLYSRGMRPLMYSEKQFIEKQVGWHRVGTDMTYSSNESESDDEDEDDDSRPLNTLAFTITFERKFFSFSDKQS